MNAIESAQLQNYYSDKSSTHITGGIGQWCSKPSHKVYRAKQTLYSQGDTFQGLFQLRSGAAKSVIHSKHGEALITEFLFPGDIAGLDGFNQCRYTQTVSFIQTSSIVFLNQSKTNQLLATSDPFRQRVLESLTSKLIHEQHLLLESNSCKSEQRFARFILEMSETFKQRSCSATEFCLPMSRTDIANYLGMALETLSRLLCKFQCDAVLQVDKRMVEITNVDKLKQKAGLLFSSNKKNAYQ